MTCDDIKRWIRNAKRRNSDLRKEKRKRWRQERCVGFSVSLLYHYCFGDVSPIRSGVLAQDREDLAQQARCFLRTKPGRAAVTRWWKGKKPDAYLTTAIYRHLLTVACKWYGIDGKAVRLVLVGQVPAGYKFDQVQRSSMDEADIDRLLDRAPARAPIYLKGRWAGQTDAQIREQAGWTESEFYRIRAYARDWLQEALDVHVA